MKALLAFVYNHFEFLYLDSRYRITNSSTSGDATSDASLRLTGPTLSFWLSNECGQLWVDVAPTKYESPKTWFRIPIVRQYFDDSEDTTLTAAESAAWIGDNLARIEGLFADDVVAASCDALSTLEKVSADKRFGPPQAHSPL